MEKTTMPEKSQASGDSRDAFPRRVPHVQERLVDGELILYDPKLQKVHALNATAAFVWQACDGEHAATEIAAALVERYPKSREEIERDVPEIVERFLDEGLLER
jgi:hypothetical protein